MSDAEEFRLRIEAYSPETMPMQRLAEYLAQLAVMLGENASVHFVRLEGGSTSIIHKIEREAIPKVKERASSVRRGVGPRDSVRAYRKINKLLRDDNGRAVWREERTETQIVVFPGKDDAQEEITGISQRGSVDGEIVRVGGPKEVVPIMLKCEHEDSAGFWAARALAKELARRLFEPVRLFGTGRWNRNEDGKWKLDLFRVESFLPLRDEPLSSALNELRAIQVDWTPGAYDELSALRFEGGEHGGV